MNGNTINNAVTMRPDRGASLGRIDQYELIRELGGGGFGCVYLARDTVAGIEVAVKGLPPLVRLNKEELENVRKNFALVSRLHHPNIAAALTLHPVTNAFYNDKTDAEKLRVFSGDTLVVMQYAPGVTLSQWRKQFPDGKVPLDKALEITRQIASALDYAHKEKILHRDIKPANVMLTPSGDICLIDFNRWMLANDDDLLEKAACGDEIYVVVSETPFYAESGGQVGDCGWIESTEGEKIEIINTIKENGLPVHIATAVPSTI